jgi:hypothetical protein
VLNELQALHMTAPVSLRERIGAGTGKQLATRLLKLRNQPSAPTSEQIILEVLRDLARRARDLTTRAETHRAELDRLIRALDHELLEEPGIGPISTAKLPACDPHQLTGEPHSHAATAPPRSQHPQTKRSATDSHTAATARPTTPSTPTPSATHNTTPKHAPTSNAASQKAKPPAKPYAASNTTTPAAPTNASSPYP